MSSNSPTVYVVDADAAARESIAALAASHGYRAEVYDSAELFLANYDGNAAGCLITDQRLTGLTGTDLLQMLNSAGAHLPVILVTANATVPLAVQAMELGALTVLEKPCKNQELWQNIEQALQLDARGYAARLRTNENRRRLSTLLDDERAVLDRILAGRPNKSIAHELGIGLRTVEARRQSIFHKLNAQSLAELLRIVLDARHAAPIPQGRARPSADDEIKS